jgi:hypothetical protein
MSDAYNLSRIEQSIDILTGQLYEQHTEQQKTLDIIARELIILNVPMDRKMVQREYLKAQAMHNSIINLLGLYSEKMDKFKSDTNSEEYINAKKLYDFYKKEAVTYRNLMNDAIDGGAYSV